MCCCDKNKEREIRCSKCYSDQTWAMNMAPEWIGMSPVWDGMDYIPDVTDDRQDTEEQPCARIGGGFPSHNYQRGGATGFGLDEDRTEPRTSEFHVYSPPTAGNISVAEVSNNDFKFFYFDANEMWGNNILPKLDLGLVVDPLNPIDVIGGNFGISVRTVDDIEKSCTAGFKPSPWGEYWMDTNAFLSGNQTKSMFTTSRYERFGCPNDVAPDITLNAQGTRATIIDHSVAGSFGLFFGQNVAGTGNGRTLGLRHFSRASFAPWLIAAELCFVGGSISQGTLEKLQAPIEFVNGGSTSFWEEMQKPEATRKLMVHLRLPGDSLGGGWNTRLWDTGATVGQVLPGTTGWNITMQQTGSDVVPPNGVLVDYNLEIEVPSVGFSFNFDDQQLVLNRCEAGWASCVPGSLSRRPRLSVGLVGVPEYDFTGSPLKDLPLHVTTIVGNSDALVWEGWVNDYITDPKDKWTAALGCVTSLGVGDELPTGKGLRVRRIVQRDSGGGVKASVDAIRDLGELTIPNDYLFELASPTGNDELEIVFDNWGSEIVDITDLSFTGPIITSGTWNMQTFNPFQQVSWFGNILAGLNVGNTDEVVVEHNANGSFIPSPFNIRFITA